LFEVEVKAQIEEIASIESQLLQLGASFQQIIHQSDIYFQHPIRNFAQTDEALRIRIADNGNYLTYKGPKIDSVSKTREELELEVQDPLKFIDLLKKIGLNPIMKVIKSRRSYLLNDISISIDTIEELGTFIELELDVPDKGQLPTARERLFTILKQLKISPNKFERRSYLELLIK
jgi:adenylate cyclase, class 2